MGSTGRSPNIWAPYDTTKDCSLGICSIYCPQWCYIIVPPPPDFGLPDEDDDHDSGTNFSPLIIAIIGILACVFILLTYYTLISKYCRRRRRRSGGGGSDGRGIEIEENRDPMNPGSLQQPNSTGLDETLIKSITVFKYNKNDKLIEGTDCSVCLSEFQENENLRLLPMCTHAFHLPCIDTWLKSNSSCPLCRSNINSISVPSNPVAPQQVQPMLNQETQQNQLNISRSEYQHRNNESTVLVIVQDSELGTQESVFNLSSENVPKTPNEESREREVNDDDQAVRANGFQPIRRSISFNSSLCQSPVLVSDILSASEEGEDIMIHMENLVQFSRGIGSSKGGGEVIEEQQHCKKNDTSGAFNLVRSHLSMKRSISTGRFVFTRHGKGNNSILPN